MAATVGKIESVAAASIAKVFGVAKASIGKVYGIAMPAGGVPFLDGWSYRKSITLSRASGAVNNYQMKLLVGESSGATGEDVDCGGHVAADFDDLRFTTSDGSTLCDYWIESISGSTPNGLATVWIEFPTIGTGATTFYMYYGGTETAVSSGADTFLEFDAFIGNNDDAWDAAKWTSATQGTVKSGTAATIQSNKGQLYQASNTNGQWSALERDAKNTLSLATDGLSIRGKTSIGVTASRHHGFGFAKTGEDFWTGKNVKFQTSNGKADIADHTGVLASVSKTSEHIYEIQMKQWQARLLEDDVEIISFTSFSADVTNSVFMWAAGWSNSSTFETSAFDYILVRRYLATEPAWGSWGSEESA